MTHKYFTSLQEFFSTAHSIHTPKKKKMKVRYFLGIRKTWSNRRNLQINWRQKMIREWENLLPQNFPLNRGLIEYILMNPFIFLMKMWNRNLLFHPNWVSSNAAFSLMSWSRVHHKTAPHCLKCWHFIFNWNQTEIYPLGNKRVKQAFDRN